MRDLLFSQCFVQWFIFPVHMYFCSIHCAKIFFSLVHCAVIYFSSEYVVPVCRLFFLMVIYFFSEYLGLHSLLCMWHRDFYWAFPFKLVCSCCFSSWPGHHLNIRLCNFLFTPVSHFYFCKHISVPIKEFGVNQCFWFGVLWSTDLFSDDVFRTWSDLMPEKLSWRRCRTRACTVAPRITPWSSPCAG